MSKHVQTLDDILDDIVSRAKNYELQGVEFVPEDAIRVLTKTSNGMSYDDAVNLVLSEIHDCLHEGDYDNGEENVIYEDSYFA